MRVSYIIILIGLRSLIRDSVRAFILFPKVIMCCVFCDVIRHLVVQESEEISESANNL